MLAKHDSRTVIYYTRNECEEISKYPIESIPNFTCEQIEADTVMFYVYTQLRKQGDTSAVVMDSEDMDVVVLSSLVSSEVDGELFLK